MSASVGAWSAMLGRWLRRTVRARLERLHSGRLRLIDSEGESVYGHDPADLGEVALRVHDPGFYGRVAWGGTNGAAESYMAGEWESDDLTSLVRLLVRNRDVLLGLDDDLGWPVRPLDQLRHRLRRNHRAGSRRNIQAHYDLGNDFYRLFLDSRMMYSCAFFEHADMTLEAASLAKLERVCRKLGLGPEDHVLEIGTGWGGFALHAASRYGCKVTTTTVSPAQRRYALEQVRAAGLEDRIEILDRDYRDLEGRFDKLVSIEMIEAVGLDHLETYFACCARLLEPGGRMLLQSITIADALFERARRSVDFIQRYVFPGSALPSLGALEKAIAAASDLAVLDREEIGPHYARTLAAWRARFQAQLDEVRRQGFSEAFIRLWEFYFCYCEGGFLERSIGDVQMLLAKPGPERTSETKR